MKTYSIYAYINIYYLDRDLKIMQGGEMVNTKEKISGDFEHFKKAIAWLDENHDEYDDDLVLIVHSKSVDSTRFVYHPLH